MYTSFMNTGNASQMGLSHSRGFRNRNHSMAPPTRDELVGNQDHPLMSLSQRVLEGKAVVRHVMSETAFVIYHEDFRQEFVCRKIGDDEDIENWINLQTHSNVVTAFDSFIDEMSGCQFSMVEINNHGSIFQYIKSLNLDLAVDVPRSYLETVYDVAIQLATGLDFAHNAGLVHGQFDLSKVVLQKDGDNIVYKVSDFAPGSSMNMPLSPESNYWPFSKQKKQSQITKGERLEVLMLKDIYSLGICILELMIGRTSKQQFSISLDSLPLTWAEFPESTPIIQVLVECIQIDSITQRKGKLQHIRKLLIREYKKYFQRPFYKNETPFVGKKADVFNKRGIVDLFHNREQQALKNWNEARIISDRHFDSQCNASMHRWSTGVIGDGQLMSELGQFVFGVPGKGSTLECYLKIAIGEREDGMLQLTEFIAETEKEEKQKGQKTMQNLKNNKQLKAAKEVQSAVQLNKKAFFNNLTIKHGHKETIKCLAFSLNSNFMVSICSQSTKVWKVLDNIMGNFLTIPQKDERVNDKDDEIARPIAAIDNSGENIVIYRGGLEFNVYQIFDRNDFNKTDTIDLRKEILANGHEGMFEFAASRDTVDGVAYLGDNPTHFRVYLSIQGNHFFADVNIADGVTELKRAERFSDQSIFAVDANEASHSQSTLRSQQRMRTKVNQQLQVGNIVHFPSEDQRYAVILNKEDLDEKYFMVYDVKRDNYVRRVAKKTNDDEAVCVNSSATLLTFVEGLEISVRSIRLPNAGVLIDCLRPRYIVAESKLNPGQACLNKQVYKDKLYRELHTYHMFKEDPAKAEKTAGLTEEQNVQLMVLKYAEASRDPYKMKANRELMMLQKVLLRDAVKTEQMKDLQAKCPLIGVVGLKRIEIYDDELAFVKPTDDNDIDLVQMSSEPHRNFFLLAMNGIVFKYDLVTKELLFQFKTNAHKAMLLYDRDDKLVVASDNEVRLWDFFDHKEEAPELLTMMTPLLKVENIFINKNCENRYKLENKPEDQVELFVLITCKNEFVLYERRLVEKFRGSIDKAVITAACFSRDSSLLLIGTSKGQIITYKVNAGDPVAVPVGNPFQASQDLPVTKLECLMAIEESNDAFLMTIGEFEKEEKKYDEKEKKLRREKQAKGEQVETEFVDVAYGKDLFLYIHNKGEARAVDYGDGKNFENNKICNIQIAANNKFFCIGIPEKRALGFFSINRTQLVTKPLVWSTKNQFCDFFADDHLSTLMFLNHTRNHLDYQFVIWKFDTKELDENKTLKSNLNKLDTGVVNVGKEDQEDINSIDSQGNEINKTPVDQITGSSCCTIF